MAIISHRKKYIYIHIEKTAGTAIRHSIERYMEERTYTHEPLRELQTHFDTSEYFVFSSIRNPWDRAASWYRFYVQCELRKPDAMEFGKFLKEHYSPKRPQYDYIVDANGEYAVDDMIRYETLYDDYNRVCSKIGVDLPLKKLNVTKKTGPYQEYYTDSWMIDLIHETNRKDIEHFGYSFE